MTDSNVFVGAVSKAAEDQPPVRKADKPQSVARLSEKVSQEIATVELNEVALFENRVVSALKKDTRVEPYRQLRTQVLKAMSRHGWRTMAITSAEQGGGSTLTAVNLALALTEDGNQSVVLVDLDLRNPSIHRTLGLEPDLGLVDYLTNRAQLDKVLCKPNIAGLQVLPGRSTDDNAPSLLSSARMTSLVNELVRIDPTSFVIFDLPSLLHTDEATAFAPTVDATLLVIEEGGTTDEDLKQAMQLLHDVNVIGTVLNKARP